VADGKHVWGSFLGKSEETFYVIYILAYFMLRSRYISSFKWSVSTEHWFQLNAQMGYLCFSLVWKNKSKTMPISKK
jgi:hypothetical protein